MNSVWFYWGTAAIMLVAALWGWHRWDVRQTEKADRIAQMQARAALAEREAKELAERQQAEADRLKAEAERRRADAEAETERRRADAEAESLRVEQEKREREQRKQRMVALQERFLNVPEVGLLDALAQISLQQDIRIAIDPDVIGAVGNIRVKPTDLAILANREKRNDWLGRQGFVMRSCPISDKDTNRVDLVTTESIWAYSCASQQLRNGQLARALQALETVRADDSEFGAHCLSLRTLLQDFNAQQADASELALKIRRKLKSCGNYQKGAQMYARGAEMASDRESSNRLGDRRVQEAMAKSNYSQALQDLRGVCTDLEAFKRKMITSSGDLASRYETAFDAELHTEAKFLVDGYIEAHTSLRGLYAEVEKTGLLTDVKTAQHYGMEEALRNCAQDAREFGTDMVDVPEGLRRTRAAIDNWVKVSSGQTGVLRLDASSQEDLASELRASGRALMYDRGNILARAAAGYYRVQLHGQVLHSFLYDQVDDGQRIQALARELDSGKKSGMLRAVMDISGRMANAQISAGGHDKIGSVSGLCIFGSESEGEIMQISVQIIPRNHSISTREVTVHGSSGVVTPYAGYWRSWGATERYVYETISEPIVFEDYGRKDDDMTISAIETYRWLCKTFPSNMLDHAVHIAFHHLEEGKRGDSAGAAMALAAFSTIKGLPVRADVAITGSIRSDGSILGVGGIFEKIRGAAIAPFVEVIIIPRENEGDAMLVPLDDLCHITVISADDMSTYLNYATEKAYRQHALENLRKAQIHLLTGQRDLAEPLLLEVAAECPENFTARRLLELIAFCRMTGQVGVASAKSP